MVYGVRSGPPVNEASLESFRSELSSLPVEQWQDRVKCLRSLVDTVPDYSTTEINEEGVYAPPTTGNNGSDVGNEKIPWYRSSKAVRKLERPLKSLLLDARSAVVKETTDLIGTLLTVKLQPHPSLVIETNGNSAELESGLRTIEGSTKSRVPPPAFVGRLLLKDLIPTVLDMSKQTVKVIRTEAVSMMLDILPHCRVKSVNIVMLEKMKSHKNRSVREDCARYLRCVLETWPWDPTGSQDNISNQNVDIVNSRKEERLSLDSTRQIGLGLGRALSDSAKPVRDEAKKGIEALFRRFRPVWDEVLNSGVIRDVRLRKKLLESASSSNQPGSKLFDDASLGDLSLNSAVSGLSYASHRSAFSNRSYASQTYGNRGTNIPSVIGTPSRGVPSPRNRSNIRYGPSGSPLKGSPSYMRGTGSSSARNGADQEKIRSKEGPTQYSANQYVTSSGHILSTPSPRSAKRIGVASLRGGLDAIATEQPFASLLQTPNQSSQDATPDSKPKSAKILRKRLSHRISGVHVDGAICTNFERQLSSINESETKPTGPSSETHSAEVSNVALEVIAAHLSHIEKLESLLHKEKDVLLGISEELGVSITDSTQTDELVSKLRNLSEEKVCDYFEEVYQCADRQKKCGEQLIEEMEKICQGSSNTTAPDETHLGDIDLTSGDNPVDDLLQSPSD
ncbi:hypothetical protein THAOC_07139 [Thalassiosira oceanica]|uniref:CLASP N-terminal domain-containing protein n=1 Tax=Thalassiosira oceanica TaxID=159749 RepID=K0SYB0_THAOC|nr:hypothetical protein THAOC_07139 [Thalassiosira oceanica]|mmetsp:Transcript_18643/g.43659  ORF Transcript_18643/g.43659 Transcript_18643/m.43659 type:complete len:679 (-) Transcript_18643:3131-5167(-)|eukprot:EJK71423.1 hypothetical protein THAOC_07139 [Thalassiosira oceanica]